MADRVIELEAGDVIALVKFKNGERATIWEVGKGRIAWRLNSEKNGRLASGIVASERAAWVQIANARG